MFIQLTYPTLAFVKPYLVSVLPAGSVSIETHARTFSSTGEKSSVHLSATLEVRSSLSYLPDQIISITSASDTPVHHTLRLLTPSPSAKSPLFLISTPTDRTIASAEGSTIWQVRLTPWSQQIDELVNAGSYSGALALLDTIDAALLPDKVPSYSKFRLIR